MHNSKQRFVGKTNGREFSIFNSRVQKNKYFSYKKLYYLCNCIHIFWPKGGGQCKTTLEFIYHPKFPNIKYQRTLTSSVKKNIVQWPLATHILVNKSRLRKVYPHNIVCNGLDNQGPSLYYRILMSDSLYIQCIHS